MVHDKAQRELCVTQEEFHKFMNMSALLYSSGEVVLERITGCQSSCKYFDYELKEIARVEKVFPNKDNATEQLLVFSVFITDPSYTVEREVLKYDVKDLVADVGGYLGLLLGASILNAVEYFTAALSRWMLGKSP